MKRETMSFSDPLRKVQADSSRPIGFLPSIGDQVRRLASDVEGLELRLRRRLSDGEPAAIVAQRVFAPDAQVFNFDFLQDGSSSSAAQYVVRDAITYEIAVTFPPPGYFVARYLVVKMYQRWFDNVTGVAQQLPILTGNQMLRISDGGVYTTLWGLDQTPKFAFPTQVAATAGGGPYSAAMLYARRCNFFWNMLDAKSGRQLADALISDQVLLPQAMGAGGVPWGSMPDVSESQAFTNGRFEFRVPWLFERDGQATFFFRPITPIIQPAASSGLAATLKQNGAVDMSVTLQIELHGSRYLTMRDAMQLGARFHEPGDHDEVAP